MTNMMNSLSSNVTDNVLQLAGKESGIWYGVNTDTTNRPSGVSYGAVRILNWSSTNYNNSDVELISFTSPFKHYYNHYLNTTGWSGWRESSEGAHTSLQDMIYGKSFTFNTTVATGKTNKYYNISAGSNYSPIAIKTVTLSGTNKIYIAGWAFVADEPNNLYLDLYNEGSAATVTLTIIMIYVDTRIVGNL